jgi:hypothetical protein
MEHGRRKILYFHVTRHPTAEWLVQQLRETFQDAGPYRYVIFDRDSKFDDAVIDFLKATGLEAKRTSIEAPWQNGIMEAPHLAANQRQSRSIAMRIRFWLPTGVFCGLFQPRLWKHLLDFSLALSLPSRRRWRFLNPVLGNGPGGRRANHLRAAIRVERVFVFPEPSWWWLLAVAGCQPFGPAGNHQAADLVLASD